MLITHSLGYILLKDKNESLILYKRSSLSIKKLAKIARVGWSKFLVIVFFNKKY